MPVVKKQATKKRGSRKHSTRERSVIDRIAPIGFDDSDGVKLNVYGRSGTGKTTLWATFPKPILAIICSGGSKPGELRSINTPGYRKTIKQVPLKTSSEIKELVAFQSSSNEFATIVLDHASGLQDMALKEILGLDKIPEQLSWGVASQQQYGQCALQMKTQLRLLLDLPCNVVIVAQEREFNTESESNLLMPYVASALTPSVVGWLNPACDYICETFIRPKMVEKEIKVKRKTITRLVRGKGVEYCLRVAPDEIYTTKFRVPKGTPLPDVLVDPDFDKIKKLIQGG